MASPEHDGGNHQYFVKEIDLNEIEHLETVGEGSFGIVYKGKWRDNYVAIKKISEKEIEAFIVEVRQLSRVNHENIVKLYGACTKSPDTCLIMEYAEGGSLFNILHNAPGVHYTLAHGMSWLYQCARGVEYLHSMQPKPLIHRDLKPPNLLLINGGTLLKICDFGTAVDKTAVMTNNKGSAAWMAPEVFATSSYTEKCDVFSWGIILWEVLSRLKPFFHIKASGSPSVYMILWAKHRGDRPPLIRDCPKQIEDLMTQCWDQDATKRPSMHEIVKRMTLFCRFLPGADEPLVIADGDEVIYEDAEEERTIPDQVDQFPSNVDVNGVGEVTRSLPQPSGDMMSPLSLEIDPNAWELEDPRQDARLQTMPGFDCMVPLNGSTNTVQAGIQSATSTSSTSSPTNNSADADLDEMYLLLDPHLRPATPDRGDATSMALFEEHKQLAKEMLKVQTETALLAQRKDKLLAAQTEEQKNRRRTFKRLQDEKESLIKLREFLMRQSEKTRNSQRPQRTSEDNWVLVPRPTDNHN